MKRRAFLSILGAAGLSPAVKALPAAAAPKAIYNRTTYGFAVFWARHGGQFGARQLATAMRVSDREAEAMIYEMIKDRVVRSASGGGLRATTVHGGALRGSAGRLATRSLPQGGRRSLYWKFRQVGLRARRLQWQLFSSEEKVDASV